MLTAGCSSQWLLRMDKRPEVGALQTRRAAYRTDQTILVGVRWCIRLSQDLQRSSRPWRAVRPKQSASPDTKGWAESPGWLP